MTTYKLREKSERNRNVNLNNLITDEDNKVIHELKRLIGIIKPKYFSLGRDINKFMDTVEKFGKLKEESHGTVLESISGSSVVGNTLVRVRQTVITNT